MTLRERVASAFREAADQVAEDAWASDYWPERSLQDFMADDRIRSVLALLEDEPADEITRLRTGGLGNVSRALEVVDAHLVAIQSKLAEIDTLDSEDRVESTMEIVDHLDLIIGDVRAASADVTKHDCIPKGMVLVHPKYFEHLRNCEKFAVHEGQVKPTDWEKPS